LGSLVLRGIPLDPSICPVIKGRAAALTKLDFTDCDWTCTDEIASAMMDCVNLTDLRLEFCRKVSSKVLQSILVRCLDLVVLGLSGCAVTDQVLRKLLVDLSAKEAVRRRSLHTLMLSQCQLLTEKAIEYLSYGTHLSILRLRGCAFITPGGTLRLAKSLRNISLLDLELCPSLPKPSKSLAGKDSDRDRKDYANLRSQLFLLAPAAAVLI
jgi:hypothetical protein